MKPIHIKILILCLASLIIGISVSWGVFDAVPHLEDEHANLFQAKVFASGNITRPTPDYPYSFFIPFVIDMDGHQFSKYTPGYALFLALGVLIKIPWIMNPIFAALGIFAVFLLARELFDEKTGLLAVVLGVISPLYMVLSGTFISHPLSITLLTFFAWAFIRLHRVEKARQTRFALLSGFLMGYAMLTRPWTAIGVGVPFVIYALVQFIRNPKVLWKPYLFTFGIFTLIMSFLPIYNYVTTGEPFINTYAIVWKYDTVGFGPEHGPNGYDLAKMWHNLKADIRDFGQYLLGWPLARNISIVWAFILFGLVLPKRSKTDWLILTPAMTCIIAYMAFWARSGDIYGPRYYSESLPFFWILASRGLLKFEQYKINYWITRVALLVFVMWNVIMVTYPAFNKTRDLYDINRDDSRRIEHADLHNAIVFVHSNYWTDFANLSWKNPTNLEKADVLFARDFGEKNQIVLDEFPGRAIYYYNRNIPPYLEPANP